MNTRMVVPSNIQALSHEVAHTFRQVMSETSPAQLAVGQIWSTHGSFSLPNGQRFYTEDPRLVVVLGIGGSTLAGFEQISVAPLSLDLTMASDFDLRVKEAMSPLGFDFLVEIWNTTPTLRAQLKRYLGTLPEAVLAALLELHHAQTRDDDAPIALASWIGPRLMGKDDPRMAFQRAEIEAMEYLSLATVAALGLEELTQEARHTKHVRWAFDLRLMLGKISEYLRPTGPAVALAAGSLDEEGITYLVYQPGANGFTIELLYRQRPPHNIYAKVWQISPTLEDHLCTIAVETATDTWESDQVVLRVQETIQIGESEEFSLSDVQSVRVVVEEGA